MDNKYSEAKLNPAPQHGGMWINFNYLYSDKEQEKESLKFIDYLIKHPWTLENTQCGNNTPTIITDFVENNAVDNKMDKWTSRMAKNYLKCKDASSESKKLNVYKICHTGCAVTKPQEHDDIYVGKMEMKLNQNKRYVITTIQWKILRGIRALICAGRARLAVCRWLGNALHALTRRLAALLHDWLPGRRCED